MMRSEAIAVIKRGLGFRQTQDTAIIAALQAAQRILETGRTLPGALLSSSTLAITPGNPGVVLPDRFLRLSDEVESYYVLNGAPVFLPHKHYEEAFQTYAAGIDLNNPATNTYPKVLVIQGKTLGLLYPVPTVTTLTSFILNYYKGEPILDAEIENAWLKYSPEYLIGLAGMQVAGNLRDKDALTSFTTMHKLGLNAFLGDVVEDELAGRPLVMGRDN